MNCLGYCEVLRGQKRLPMPPAIMTIWFITSDVHYNNLQHFAKINIYPDYPKPKKGLASFF